MEIKKKVWPEYFQLILDGKKKFEIRLADFNLNKGDILILEEYEPEDNRYTGRKIRKKVNFVIKFDPTKMHSLEEIKKFGFYLAGIE